MSILTSGKGIWIYKRSLNLFPFQTSEHKKKTMKMKMLERKSIVCSNFNFFNMKKGRKWEKRPMVNLSFHMSIKRF